MRSIGLMTALIAASMPLVGGSVEVSRPNTSPSNGRRRVRAVRIGKARIQRLAPANFGGNWKGTEYLSYREHDLLTRLTRLGPAHIVEPGIDVYAPVSRGEAMQLIKSRRR